MKMLRAGDFEYDEEEATATYHVENSTVESDMATVFGYAHDQPIYIVGENTAVEVGEYFCYSSRRSFAVDVVGNAFLAFVFDYQGHPFIRGRLDLEGPGHLKYIDGCTDSLLICPPKLGQPCLNALYMPPHTNQRYHHHPSLRSGVIVSGSGWCEYLVGHDDRKEPLERGQIFHLPRDEEHRFKTDDHPLLVLVFHPDSDFGPTDDDHPMKNRTVI